MQPFLPLLPHIVFADFNHLDSVQRHVASNDCAAVFVEPIQGEGGVVPATRHFLQGLEELCRKHGTLLVCDEVQCGLGRTGTLFAHEVYDIHPDIVTLAKPLAGGLPIGAVLATDSVAEAVTPGMHGTTFGGNAVVCRAAQVVLDRLLSKDFLPVRLHRNDSVIRQHVRERGRQLAAGLKQLDHPVIEQIRVPIDEQGLFAGIQCRSPVAPILERALEHGLMCLSAGEQYVST